MVSIVPDKNSKKEIRHSTQANHIIVDFDFVAGATKYSFKYLQIYEKELKQSNG